MENELDQLGILDLSMYHAQLLGERADLRANGCEPEELEEVEAYIEAVEARISEL